MKRYAVVGILLLVVVVLGSGVFANIMRGQTMEVRFNKQDLPEHGVYIVTSVDPSFDEMAAKHFKNRQPTMLKPLAVFIKNSSQRLIVAYALTWELKDHEGRNITSKTVGYSEPGILIGNEIPMTIKHTTAIEPGKERCFSWDSKIDENAQDRVETDVGTKQIRDMIAAQVARASDVVISLDSVIFDDGSFIGPNRTVFINQMRAMVLAKSDLLRDVAEASEGGNIDQVLDSISAIGEGPEVVFGSTFSEDEWYRHFKKVYATEISNQRAAYGKERIVPSLVRSHGRVKKLKELRNDSSK